MARISYCQLSIDDEIRKHGVHLLTNVFRNDMECAGWGRGVFDGTFATALRKAVSRPGPLIVTLINKADDSGQFADAITFDSPPTRITPEMFWNGIEGSRWPGFASIVKTTPAVRGRASPIYLIVGQFHGLAYARRLREVASHSSMHSVPDDCIVSGLSFTVSPASAAKMPEKELRKALDADQLQIEEMCRLICRRERYANVNKLKESFSKLVLADQAGKKN